MIIRDFYTSYYGTETKYMEVNIMSIVTKVAKMRLLFHANMLDVCNVANQLGILKDSKAEVVMKGHAMKCFDAMEHMGLDVKKFMESKD